MAVNSIVCTQQLLPFKKEKCIRNLYFYLLRKEHKFLHHLTLLSSQVVTFTGISINIVCTGFVTFVIASKIADISLLIEILSLFLMFNG